ncbi:MAG: hypothetical protein ACRDWW_07885 [Acidimicrobiales bacterium]
MRQADTDAKFTNWFQSPLFEPEDGERLEELASLGRGPVRLGAAAMVSAGAWSARLRRAPDDPFRRDAARVARARDGLAELDESRPPIRRAAAGALAGWRDRAARTLDAWAEREVSVSARLESAIGLGTAKSHRRCW